MSITMQDGTSAGILDVTSNFYEFIPAAQIDEPEPDCLRSHEVEMGRDYFVVLTSSAGLYRYSIGDQIRVVGFEGQAPIIEFLNKGEHISSLTGEKLSEHQVVVAINQAAAEPARWGADQARWRASGGLRIGNYVLAPQWDDPPYYRLHIETAVATSRSALERFSQAVDRQLRQLNVEYGSKQESLRLGRLRANLLPEGFLEARDQALSTRYRRNNEQYKHKFLLTRPGEDQDFPIAEIAGRGIEASASVGSNGAALTLETADSLPDETKIVGVPLAACPPVPHKQSTSTGRQAAGGTPRPDPETRSSA